MLRANANNPIPYHKRAQWEKIKPKEMMKHDFPLSGETNATAIRVDTGLTYLINKAVMLAKVEELSPSHGERPSKGAFIEYALMQSFDNACKDYLGLDETQINKIKELAAKQ